MEGCYISFSLYRIIRDYDERGIGCLFVLMLIVCGFFMIRLLCLFVLIFLLVCCCWVIGFLLCVMLWKCWRLISILCCMCISGFVMRGWLICVEVGVL